MRIALFAETYLPYINGVVTHLKVLKEGLEALGHTVLVVTADANARRHYVQDGVLYCPATRVKKLYNYGVAVPYSRARLRLVQEFAPDVIHVHQEFGVGLSGVYIAHRLRLPLVYTLHTMYDEYIYYVAPGFLSEPVTKMSHQYFRFLARRADALTGPSKKCEEFFRGIGVTAEVNVVPNAVELDSFMPDSVPPSEALEVRRRHGLPEDCAVVGFVGRLGREKSVDVLLDYWAATITPQDKLHLCIIGDGPVRPELAAQAASLGIGDMVTFTGAVQHADIAPYYAAFDMYATASVSDTNSISMLEGMATGLPVIHRRDELNAGQVVEGVNGYLFANAAEMAARLRLVRDMPPDKLAELRASSAASVRESGAKTLGANIVAVYKKAIRAHMGRRRTTIFAFIDDETE